MENAVGRRVTSYTLAGWVSIIQAVIILPRIGADLFVKHTTLPGYGIIQLFTGFNAVGYLLGIYVLLMFRRLLNDRHSFHKADKPISAIILCHAAFAVIWALDLVLHAYLDLLLALLIVSVLSSLLNILFAIKLLRLEANLSGLLKPYVYATIAGAVLGASLILG